jgi:flagellin
MGLRINTNIASVNAQRNTENRTGKVNVSLERLSSGARINKASDDAAGLAISTKFRAKIKGFQQAKRNGMDGISMIQTAEGGLNETSNILGRLRELAVQAASDTVGKAERGFLDLEFQALVDEVDRIAMGTEYNGVNLLQGQDGNPNIEGGVLDLQVGVNNNEAIDRFSFNPNSADARKTQLGADSLGGEANIASTGVKEKSNAQKSLATIDKAIMDISGMRASFGALQNRIQSSVNNISIQVENMSSATSRILDTDIAYETSELAKNQILGQASTSVLAQANASGGLALKLIG